MTFARYAQTDVQEKSLAAIEKAAQKTGYRLSFGTTIGKNPQTVVLDHKYQDGVVHVNRDGKITVNDEEVSISKLLYHFAREKINETNNNPAKDFGGVFG